MPVSARLVLGRPHGHGAQPRWGIGTHWKAMTEPLSSVIGVTQRLDVRTRIRSSRSTAS